LNHEKLDIELKNTKSLLSTYLAKAELSKRMLFLKYKIGYSTYTLSLSLLLQNEQKKTDPLFIMKLPAAQLHFVVVAPYDVQPLIPLESTVLAM
jgi:hypothetical protein